MNFEEVFLNNFGNAIIGFVGGLAVYLIPRYNKKFKNKFISGLMIATIIFFLT